MASRRKKRKADIDPLGGFSLEQLLGAEPVIVLEKKRSLIGTVLGAPFRLLAALVRLPMRLIASVLKVPVRLVGALVPSRQRGG